MRLAQNARVWRSPSWLTSPSPSHGRNHFRVLGVATRLEVRTSLLQVHCLTTLMAVSVARPDTLSVITPEVALTVPPVVVPLYVLYQVTA